MVNCGGTRRFAIYIYIFVVAIMIMNQFFGAYMCDVYIYLNRKQIRSYPLEMSPCPPLQHRGIEAVDKASTSSPHSLASYQLPPPINCLAKGVSKGPHHFVTVLFLHPYNSKTTYPHQRDGKKHAQANLIMCDAYRTSSIIV